MTASAPSERIVVMNRLMQECRPAAFMVLCALLIDRRALGCTVVSRRTGLNLETVRTALGRLESLGYAANVGGHDSWCLTADGRQLPLPFGQLEDEAQADPAPGDESAEIPRFAFEAGEAEPPGSAALPTAEPEVIHRGIETAEIPRFGGQPHPPDPSGRSLTLLTTQPDSDLPDLGGDVGGTSPPGDGPPSEREQSERLLKLAGIQSGKEIQRLAKANPFELLYRHVRTWQRERGEGQRLGPGALVNRIDRGYHIDELAPDHLTDPLYLAASGLTESEARRRHYVPAGYETAIAH